MTTTVIAALFGGPTWRCALMAFTGPAAPPAWPSSATTRSPAGDGFFHAPATAVS